MQNDVTGAVADARTAIDLDALFDEIERYHERGSTHADLETVDDRQRQRQADANQRSQARFALHLHRAAKRGDVAFHDIHAHAASGQIRHLLRGGEPGFEDEPISFGVRQRPRRVNEPALDGLLADAFTVQAAAVVGYLDDHGTCLMVRAQAHDAREGFAARLAYIRFLDTVVDGVSHQMGQRVRHALDQLPVELGFLALGLQHDVLAGFARDVAHHALEAGEGPTDLDHS